MTNLATAQQRFQEDTNMVQTQLSNFYEVMDACHHASSVEQINEMIQSKVRGIFPHKMVAYGIGELPSRKVIHSVNAGFPESYIEEVIDQHNLLASPVAKQWSETGKPVFIKRDSIPKSYPLSWQQLFKESNIENMLVHGLMDITGKHTSYFAFANVDESNVDEAIRMVELLVPHLHVAITQVLNTKNIKQDKSVLSKREVEILKWIYEGKTNTEIGDLLCISAFTVKNHVKNILDKLGAANRTHAVAKAVSLGILDI